MEINLILTALVIIAIIGFLKQFGILSGKGLRFALAGAGLFFGFSLFQAYRSKKAEAEFIRREKELGEQEKILEELKQEIDLSDEEVYKAEASLKSEKGAYKKVIAHIDAEKEKDIQKRKEEINNMEIDELLTQF